MYDVEVSVLREVRADSPEEAEAIARSLVLAMPHINERTCPTDPEVNATVTELEERGYSRGGIIGAANLAAAQEFAAKLSGAPYWGRVFGAEAVDPDDTHLDLVDVPAADAGIYAIVDGTGQVRARYAAGSADEALGYYQGEAPDPIEDVDAILETNTDPCSTPWPTRPERQCQRPAGHDGLHQWADDQRRGVIWD